MRNLPNKEFTGCSTFHYIGLDFVRPIKVKFSDEFLKYDSVFSSVWSLGQFTWKSSIANSRGASCMYSIIL